MRRRRVLVFVLAGPAIRAHSRKVRKFGGGKEQPKLDVRTQLKLICLCLFHLDPKVLARPLMQGYAH